MTYVLSIIYLILLLSLLALLFITAFNKFHIAYKTFYLYKKIEDPNYKRLIFTHFLKKKQLYPHILKLMKKYHIFFSTLDAERPIQIIANQFYHYKDVGFVSYIYPFYDFYNLKDTQLMSRINFLWLKEIDFHDKKQVKYWYKVLKRHKK